MKIDFSNIQSIEKKSLADRIAEVVRKLILEGDLPPGTRLLEQDLSKKLGISRAVLREALRSLQEEGLVEARHNHGKFVAELDLHDMQEIYNLRKILEGFAVEIVISQANDKDLQQLSDMVDKTIKAAKNGDYERANDHDLNWHKQIWNLSNNERLYDFLSSMSAQIRMFLTINSYQYENLMDGVILHREIMNAMVARDANTAVELMKKHIQEAIETLQTHSHI